jgi:hypothetical protein
MLAGVATLRGNRLEARAQLAAAGAVVATEPGLPYWPFDRRQLLLPVADNYFCRSFPG